MNIKNFTELYTKNKSKLIYGTDYVDFVSGDYLLFIPLSPIAPLVFKFLDRINCIINNRYYCLYYNEYVVEPFKLFKWKKAFLINTKTVLSDKNYRESFISFYFKIDENKVISLGDDLYDVSNHYYNINKIHKTKYWKNLGASHEQEENIMKFWFENELRDILILTVNQCFKKLDLSMFICKQNVNY